MRLALAFLLLLSASPAAADGWFRLSTGRLILLPPIVELDCSRMRAVLDLIDSTGYRRGGPAPRDAADMALLDYEDRLSRRFYADCVRREVLSLPPNLGFGPDQAE